MSGAETHNQSESDAENDYLDPNDPDDDEEFHQKFITDMRQKE